MRKFFNWQVMLGISLVALSAGLYFVHYLFFRDSHHIFIYLLGDIAFVPVEVLLVTLIIHRLLGIHEKRAMLKKMNMAIGVFFSEVGTVLLRQFSGFDPLSGEISRELRVSMDWTEEKFKEIRMRLMSYDCSIECGRGDMESLKEFLVSRRRFLLGLLQNPNLLEHETFTDLLWAVFHLEDELAHRKDLLNLPEADYNHLAGDIKRAYILLVTEWLFYMRHLKEEYPHLFSLAVRTNPLDPNASVEVK